MWFITSPLPAIFKHILFDGGYEKAIDEIIDGTKTVSELGVEVQKNKPKILMIEQTRMTTISM